MQRKYVRGRKIYNFAQNKSFRTEKFVAAMIGLSLKNIAKGTFKKTRCYFTSFILDEDSFKALFETNTSNTFRLDFSRAEIWICASAYYECNNLLNIRDKINNANNLNFDNELRVLEKNMENIEMRLDFQTPHPSEFSRKVAYFLKNLFVLMANLEYHYRDMFFQLHVNESTCESEKGITKEKSFLFEEKNCLQFVQLEHLFSEFYKKETLINIFKYAYDNIMKRNFFLNPDMDDLQNLICILFNKKVTWHGQFHKILQSLYSSNETNPLFSGKQYYFEILHVFFCNISSFYFFNVISGLRIPTPVQYKTRLYFERGVIQSMEQQLTNTTLETLLSSLASEDDLKTYFQQNETKTTSKKYNSIEIFNFFIKSLSNLNVFDEVVLQAILQNNWHFNFLSWNTSEPSQGRRALPLASIYQEFENYNQEIFPETIFNNSPEKEAFVMDLFAFPLTAMVIGLQKFDLNIVKSFYLIRSMDVNSHLFKYVKFEEINSKFIMYKDAALYAENYENSIVYFFLCEDAINQMTTIIKLNKCLWSLKFLEELKKKERNINRSIFENETKRLSSQRVNPDDQFLFHVFKQMSNDGIQTFFLETKNISDEQYTNVIKYIQDNDRELYDCIQEYIKNFKASNKESPEIKEILLKKTDTFISQVIVERESLLETNKQTTIFAYNLITFLCILQFQCCESILDIQHTFQKEFFPTNDLVIDSILSDLRQTLKEYKQKILPYFCDQASKKKSRRTANL